MTLIRMVDCDAKITEGRLLTFAEVMEILRRQGDALAGLQKDQFLAIREIWANNCHLAVDFTPRRFRGDILLFTAAVDQPEDAPTPDAWRPYVDGAIETHLVAGRHDHMMKQSGPLAQIGSILAAKLHHITSNTSPPQGEG